jgi:hypothetical protein
MFSGALENNDFVPNFIEFSGDNWMFQTDLEALQWEENQALKIQFKFTFNPYPANVEYMVSSY